MSDAPATSSQSSPKPKDPFWRHAAIVLLVIVVVSAGSHLLRDQPGQGAVAPPTVDATGPVIEKMHTSVCPGDPAECRERALAGLGDDGEDPVGSDLTPRGRWILMESACVLGDDIACLYSQTFRKLDAGEEITDEEWRRFELGCRNGAPVACDVVGAAYLHGDGRPQDDRRAFDLFKRGCELRDNTPGNVGYMGCTRVGGMYQLGRGVAPDRKQMGQHYVLACGGADGDPTTDGDRGDPVACDILRTIIGAETGDRDLFDENLIGLTVACSSSKPHAALACAVAEALEAEAPRSDADIAREIARDLIQELDAKWQSRSPGWQMFQACDIRVASINTQEGRSAFSDEFWRHYTPKPALRYKFYNNCVELWPN